MTASDLVRLWQLADSGFPAGGFTHSSGLEAAAQYGDAATLDDVRRLALAVVRQAGHGTLPFVAAAHRGDDLSTLDARVDLFLNQPIANRASRAQGRALLHTAVQVFAEAQLSTLADMVVARELCGHHAPVFGAVLAALGIDVDTAARMWLYKTGRSVTSAAVRLGAIGMFDSQRLQAALAEEIERTLTACRDRGMDDVVQTAPILDLYQSTHDRLYSRLFQS